MSGVVGEEVWRRETPHVLAALVRRHGNLADCEDAVQEALVAAAEQWPESGVPDRPRGWLLRVASRRLVDARRRDGARAARERRHVALDATRPRTALAADDDEVEDRDDSLEVLALCCHPALTPDAQVTLALRAVLGLTTQQVAAVLLVPTTTAGRRISRAKATIDAHGRELPPPSTLADRLPSMLRALYLLFTAGHGGAAGPRMTDDAVAAEAVRLARMLHARLP